MPLILQLISNKKTSLVNFAACTLNFNLIFHNNGDLSTNEQPLCHKVYLKK